MEYEVCILAVTKLLTFVWPVCGAIHDIFICDMKPRHDALCYCGVHWVKLLPQEFTY